MAVESLNISQTNWDTKGWLKNHQGEPGGRAPNDHESLRLSEPALGNGQHKISQTNWVIKRWVPSML